MWDWTAPLVAAVRNQIVVNLLRQFERMPVRPSFRLSLAAHACLFYRVGMSVAVFVPSVSLSLYLPILFCHTNCAILPLPPEPTWLPSCSLSLSRSMIFYSFNFRFSYFYRCFVVSFNIHNKYICLWIIDSTAISLMYNARWSHSLYILQCIFFPDYLFLF